LYWVIADPCSLESTECTNALFDALHDGQVSIVQILIQRVINGYSNTEASETLLDGAGDDYFDHSLPEDGELSL
jgi:hypothetical protein